MSDPRVVWRVDGTDAFTGEHRSLYVRSTSMGAAERFASDRSFVEPRATPVPPGEVPPDAVIFDDSRPPPRTPEDRLREQPIRTIGFGVFFGLLLFSLLLVLVNALTDGQLV